MGQTQTVLDEMEKKKATAEDEKPVSDTPASDDEKGEASDKKFSES